MKPWKRSSVLRDEFIQLALQWGHGDEAVEETVISGAPAWQNPRFNGATAMKPWKRS